MNNLNLETLISKGVVLLKEKFSLEQPKAKVHFCSEMEWTNLLSHFSFEIEAFYNSFNNLIYVPQNVSLPVLIHEYFGHALFTEQSNIGRQIKAYETKLKQQDNKELKKEYAQFIDNVRPIQEGFSLCMERIMLEQLGLNKIWYEREEMLKKRPYYDCYQSLIKDIQTKGFLPVIHILGFPNKLVYKKQKF